MAEQLEKYPLPEDLVAKLFADRDHCVDYLEKVLDINRTKRPEFRQKLKNNGIVRELHEKQTDIIMAAVDGSYSAKPAVGADLGVVAAVRISHERGIDFRGYVRAFPRLPDIPRILRGLMTTLEIILLAEASEDLIVLDGSYYSLLIGLNAFFTYLAGNKGSGIWDTVYPLIEPFLEGGFFLTLLQSSKVIANSKHTTVNKYVPIWFPELEGLLDDRAFFTMALEPGEYTLPETDVQEHQRAGPLHLSTMDGLYGEAEKIETHYRQGFVRVTFYRPHPWSPAYKIELPAKVVEDGRTAQWLTCFKDEVIDPAIQEPYIQFLADRIVRQSVLASDAVFEATLYALAERGYPIEETARFLSPYRTEV